MYCIVPSLESSKIVQWEKAGKRLSRKGSGRGLAVKVAKDNLDDRAGRGGYTTVYVCQKSSTCILKKWCNYSKLYLKADWNKTKNTYPPKN